MAFGAYIQSAGVDSGAGTTRALAYGSNNAANALLFLAARFAGNPGVITVSDTRSNTWGLLGRVDTFNTGLVYRCLSGSAGANTVTLANTVSQICRWVILEYTGPGTADDADSASGYSGDDAPATPALVTTVATELLFTAIITGGDVSLTVGGSFTQRIAQGARLAAADRLVTSTGSYTPSYTISPDESWIMIAGGFSQAGGAGLAGDEGALWYLPTEQRG
jgi:hypothetical protein